MSVIWLFLDWIQTSHAMEFVRRAVSMAHLFCFVSEFAWKVLCWTNPQTGSLARSQTLIVTLSEWRLRQRCHHNQRQRHWVVHQKVLKVSRKKRHPKVKGIKAQGATKGINPGQPLVHIGSPPKRMSGFPIKHWSKISETPPGYYPWVIRPCRIHFCNQNEHPSNIYNSLWVAPNTLWLIPVKTYASGKWLCCFACRTTGRVMSRRLAGPVGLQATVAFVPEVMNNGKWSPICAHYFWNNDNGAKTVCTTLGFSGGTHQQTNTTYDTDAMPVGACYAEQDLTSCTGGGNAWGNFEESHGYCKAGTSVGITVTCGAKIGATS